MTLPAFSVRAKPEHQRLIRAVARKLRDRPDLVGALETLLTSTAPAVAPELQPPPKPLIVNGKEFIPSEYPKMVGDHIVNNPDEEAVIRALPVQTKPAPPKKSDWDQVAENLEKIALARRAEPANLAAQAANLYSPSK